MADRASFRNSVARSSTSLNRPQAPLGPRIRNRASNLSGEGYTSPSSPLSSSGFSTFASALVTSPSNPPYLPEFGPVDTVPESTPLSPITEGEPQSDTPLDPPTEDTPPQPSAVPLPVADEDEEDGLDDLEEETEEQEESREEVSSAPPSNTIPPLPASPPKAPSPAPSFPSSPPHAPSPVLSLRSSPTQAPSPALSYPSSPPQAASPALSYSSPKAIVPPKLTPPHAIKFESIPVQWKGLTLDAALWTFDSKELQSIVSRAIRSSASESYIRLLTVENLDKVLPAELERLQSVKTMTQAKYRFLVHRRTMQLQALLSSSLSPRGPKDKENEDGILTATKLVVQISETAAECDQLMEELLKVTDQISQVKRLVDHHWASALAIALRKLNGSYGRRVAELTAARERISQLEAELEDAWEEAEKMAREMDDIDAAAGAQSSDEEDDVGDEDEDEAIIETAEKINFARSLSSSPVPDSLPLSPTILSMVDPKVATAAAPVNNTNGISQLQLSQLSPLSPISPITLKVPNRQSKGLETAVDVPDSVSIKSSRSTKSAWSARSHRSTGRETRASVVSAARKRSYRTSQSSLRLPVGLSHKRSVSRPKTPYDTENQPPVPILPLQYVSPVMSAHSENASSALLPFDTNGDAGVGHLRRRTSWDSSAVGHGHQTPTPWNAGAVDDMCVRSPKKEFEAFAGRRRTPLEDDEIQVVPRTPPPVLPKVISMEDYAARPRPPRPAAKERPLNQTIPSIWMNVDAPKTPAERVDSLMRGSAKGRTYQRLRTLTKRYSLPFPIFSSKANASQPERASSHRSD